MLLTEGAKFYALKAVQTAAAWVAESAVDVAGWVKKTYIWITGLSGLTISQKLFWLQHSILSSLFWVQTHVLDASEWVTSNAIWLAGNVKTIAITSWKWVTTQAINAIGWVKTHALALWQQAKDIAIAIATSAKEILIKIAKWIAVLATNLWGILAQTAQNIWGAIMMLGPLLMYAVSATLALIGPWGIAILIIALLIYAIIMNVEGFRDKIVEVLQAVMTFLTDIVMTVVQSVIDIATNLYNTWKETLVTFFYEAVIPAVEAVADMFGDLLDGVQWVINIFDSLWQLFKMYILPVLEGALTIAIDLVITYLMALYTVIFGVIRVAWTIISTFVSLVYQFLEAIGVIDWIKKVFRDLSAWGSGPEFQQFVDTVVSGFSWIVGGLWEMIKFINGGIEGFEKLGRAARNQKILSDIPMQIQKPGTEYNRFGPKIMIDNPDYQLAISEILEAEQRQSQQKLFEQVQLTREKNEYKAIASGYDPYSLSQKAKDNDKGGGFMGGFMSMFGAGGGAGVASKLGFGTPALPAGMTKESMTSDTPPGIFGGTPDPRPVKKTGLPQYVADPLYTPALTEAWKAQTPETMKGYLAYLGKQDADNTASSKIARAGEALAARESALARVSVATGAKLEVQEGRIQGILGSGGGNRNINWQSGNSQNVATTIVVNNPVKGQVGSTVLAAAGAAAKIMETFNKGGY